MREAGWRGRGFALPGGADSARCARRTALRRWAVTTAVRTLQAIGSGGWVKRNPDLWHGAALGEE